MYHVLETKYGGIRSGFHAEGPPDRCKDYTFFSVCRNPYTRVVSAFASYDRSQLIWKGGPDTFNEWIRFWINGQHTPFLLQTQSSRHDKFEQFKIIMPVEDLLHHLNTWLPWFNETELPRLHPKASIQPDLPPLDNETRVVVESYYKEDFERFGYKRESE